MKVFVQGDQLEAEIECCDEERGIKYTFLAFIDLIKKSAGGYRVEAYRVDLVVIEILLADSWVMISMNDETPIRRQLLGSRLMRESAIAGRIRNECMNHAQSVMKAEQEMNDDA